MSDEKEVTRAELEALMFESLKQTTLEAPTWAEVARILLGSIQDRERDAAKKSQARRGGPKTG